jgi:sodium-dependent dicarboxylate transporter 2/3/5
VAYFLGPLSFFVLLLTLPEDGIGPDSHKVLALASWMIIWWMTEAVPIPVTALLPMVLFPFMGVMKMSEAATPYANPIIFLFLGGFFIALALEKHRLHERIALQLIRLTGTSGNGIIMGFMLATGLISMWISNTATAMMMLPIALSVVNLIKESKGENLTKGERNFALGLMLMVGYAASLGGLATIIGTPPNVVFVGLLEKFYERTIDFGKWMLVGVPVAIVLLLSTYVIITRILFPSGIRQVKGTEELIREKLTEMGPVSREQWLVLGVFALTSFFWIFQQALNILAGANVFDDTNIAMAGGLLMFIIPTDLTKPLFLLEWEYTKKLSWGILLLFGGGLCLAEGLNSAGVIKLVGDTVARSGDYSLTLVFLMIVVGVVLSELMSNVALVNIFVPVIFGISQSMGINPVLLAMPVTLAASIGFMLPIATPPNAIVFSSGYIRMSDMVRAGLILDLVCIGIIWVASVTLIPWIFGEGL